MSLRSLHFHKYRFVRKNALAYFRKDNWPDDMAYVISGDLETCRCGSTHLRPYQAGFSEVEVVLPAKLQAELKRRHGETRRGRNATGTLMTHDKMPLPEKTRRGR